MIHDKYIELMNQEIDEVNSKEESLELEEYLETHPEGRSCFEELREVARIFKQVEEIDSPAGLKSVIISSVSTRDIKQTRIEGDKSGFTSMLSTFRSGFKRNYVYVFTAGVLIGLCFFALLSRVVPQTSPSDMEKLYGTISLEKSSPIFTFEIPVEFDLATVSGSARFRYSKDEILTELNLLSEDEIEVVFECDEHVIFNGYWVFKSGDHHLTVAGKETKLGHTGDGNYLVFFKTENPTHTLIHMKILAGRDIVFEKTILPGRE